MQIKEFYIFRSRLARSSIYAQPTNLPRGTYRDLIKGIYANIDFPVIFKIKIGAQINDIIDTGFGSLYLISEKLKNLFKSNNLTGWETFPVILYDRNNRAIHGYHGFAVTGKCGLINVEDAKLVNLTHTTDSSPLKRYQGITTDDWDGTDFFSPIRLSVIYITTRAAEVIQKNNIGNIELTKSSDYICEPFEHKEYLEARAKLKEDKKF